MRATLYCAESDAAEWDKLVRCSNNGVFLHARRFIAYHGARFVDRSLVFRNDDGKIVAVMPCAEDPSDSSLFISHPGLTYGGFIFDGRMALEEMGDMITLALETFQSLGATKLLYKCVPVHLQSRPSQLDEYFLWKRNARLARRDLWNVIALDESRKLSKGRRWGVAKARKAGLSVTKTTDEEAYSAFYPILLDCLEDRHRVNPVHSREDLLSIQARCPEEVELWLAHGEDAIILAGVWLFKMNRRAWHSQYIASTQQGRDCQAVDLLLETVLNAAQESGVSCFSFGASTENQGKTYNAGLYNFKAGFGFGALVHDTYLIEIGA